ncbi:MAG: hypothetical protein ABFE07_28790 [Armatimonadia bacterium]
MKTRAGFVSNSSSSSFIVGLQREPDSANDLFISWLPWSKGPVAFKSSCPHCVAKAVWEMLDNGWIYGGGNPDDGDDTRLAARELSAETRQKIGPDGYNEPKLNAILKQYPYVLHVRVPYTHYLNEELKEMAEALENTALLWGE